jgi:hypothetical protein
MSLIEHKHYKREIQDVFLWILADQTAEFENELCSPLKNRVALIKPAEKYFKYRYSDEPKTREDVVNAFEAFSAQFIKNGECVDHFMSWHLAVSDLVKDDGTGNTRGWQTMLRRWSIGKCHRPKYVDSEIFDSIAQTYKLSYLYPYETLRYRIKQSDEQWMSGTNQRSDWDNFLWEIFYEDLYGPPSLFFLPAIENILVRRWWRSIKDSLTADDIENLQYERVENIQSHGDVESEFEFTDFFGPIDESFSISDIPELDALE